MTKSDISIAKVNTSDTYIDHSTTGLKNLTDIPKRALCLTDLHCTNTVPHCTGH